MTGARDGRERALQRATIVGVLAAAGWICGGCAAPQGPAPAPVQLQKRPENELARADMIPYRALVRDDFQGVAPPERYRDRPERLAAATCALLVPRERPRFRISQQPDGTFRAELINLRFRAVMDRGCSWWNPESGVAPSYVLEHEQVHFAIVELSARRLNARVRQGEIAVAGAGESIDAAVETAREQYARTLGGSLEDTVRRHAAFDRETSGGENRDAQARWVAQIEEELAASNP